MSVQFNFSELWIRVLYSTVTIIELKIWLVGSNRLKVVGPQAVLKLQEGNPGHANPDSLYIGMIKIILEQNRISCEWK